MYIHQIDAKIISDSICDGNINKLGQKSELDNLVHQSIKRQCIVVLFC